MTELSVAPKIIWGAVERYAGLRYDEKYVTWLHTCWDRLGWDPYNVDGIVNAPNVIVPMDRITDSNQSGYDRDVLESLLSDPDFNPHAIGLVVDGDRWTVWDGTHRTTAARLRGHDLITARSFNLREFLDGQRYAP